MSEPRAGRKQRANGIESRRRILDATVEIAGERGYEGTSIAAVSARCGLPASSIYWHFKDKDDLIAAVIERSFDAWLSALELPGEQAGTPAERVVQMAGKVAKSLLETPDFLRLGLMLALERRPEEPRGRAVFLQVREVAHGKVAEITRELMPQIDAASADLLATYAVAAADGLFIAHHIDRDGIDLIGLFELHARLVFEAAQRLAIEDTAPGS